MADATYAEILTAAKNAMFRLAQGAKFVTVNGQQFHYSSMNELKAMVEFCELKVAEAAGTDGRGAWEATFEDAN